MIRTTFASVASIAQLASGYTAARYLAEYREGALARADQIPGLCSVVSVAMAAVGAAALLFASRWLASGSIERTGTLSRADDGLPSSLLAVVNRFLPGALGGLESFPAIGKAGIASGTLYVQGSEQLALFTAANSFHIVVLFLPNILNLALASNALPVRRLGVCSAPYRLAASGS